MQIPTIQRRPAARLLAPGRPARPRGLPVRRLAGRGRPVLVGAPAARAARLGRLAVRLGVGLRGARGLPASARTRASPRTRSRRSSRASAFWIGDWAAFAGLGRRRRPGALRPRVAARCARYAAERGVRLLGDVPIYVARDGADVARPSRALPGRRRRRRAARRAERGRPALGQPALRLARRSAPSATAGGSSASGGRSRSSTSPGSTTSAASSPTGPCPSAHRTAKHGRWRRGPGAELFRAAERRAGPAAARRRGPRRDHDEGRGAPRRARAAGDGRDAVRLRRPALEPAPAREPPPPERRLRRHARLRHGARLVADALAAPAARDRAARASSRTGS